MPTDESNELDKRTPADRLGAIFARACNRLAAESEEGSARLRAYQHDDRVAVGLIVDADFDVETLADGYLAFAAALRRANP